MAERLTVKNFGPIKEANLEIKKIMLFIGSQASGKSTITKLLGILRDKRLIIKCSSENPSQIDQNFKEAFQKFNISSYFHEGSALSTYLSYDCSDYQIKYIDNKWSVYYSEHFLTEIESEDQRIMDFIKIRLGNNVPKLLYNSEEEYFNIVFKQNRLALYTTTKDTIYIPAERNLLSLVDDSSFHFKDVPLPDCFVEFGKMFQEARAQFKMYSIPFLGIEYRYEDGKNKVYHKNKSILLSESASGFQSIIPLMLVVETSRNGSANFIVEEPELNLFPQTQYELIKFLIGKCTQEENTLIINTHSPYLLSVLTNLLFSHKVGQVVSDSMKQEIGSFFPVESWINHENFEAYYASDGSFKSILDTKTKVISTNELDLISERIGNDFNYLMSKFRTARLDEK